MRDRVTISIDSNLKRAYENTFGKEYSELLDEAIRTKLLDSGKVEAYESVIRIVDEEQDERRHRLARIKLDLEQIQRPIEKSKEQDQELEALREEKWKKDKKSFVHQQYTGGPNWNYVMIEYFFDKRIDAERWWRSRLKKELEKGEKI